MEGDCLSWDYLLVPVGLCVLGIYHIWLLIAVLRNPTKTVIGLNSAVRKQWVFSMMAVLFSASISGPHEEWCFDYTNIAQQHNGIFSASITLSSVISLFVSTSSSSSSDSTVSQQLVYTIPLSSIKYFCILLCSLVGFLCNVQSTRYFAHASFLATLPTGKDKTDYIEYVLTTVNRGSYFWSLGLRAFYLTIPLFLWIFGAIPMFVCCCIMTNALYFVDTTTSFTQLIHSQSLKEEGRTNDVESIGQSSANSGFEDFHIRGPLLKDYDSVSAANVAR